MSSIFDNLLSDAEKVWVAEAVALVQPSTCTIRRLVSQSDGMGGIHEGYDDVETMPCRISPEQRGKVEAEVGAALRDGQTYRVSLPAATSVLLDDHLRVNGAEYSVVGVRSPSDVEIERVVYVVPAQKGSTP